VSPDSSDGAYSGARDALIQGVIAAKDQARSRGYEQLEIGFNWVYRLDPQTEREFWGHLREHGGPEFVGSLDWIGLDAYPGTFFPPAATPSEMRDAMIDGMDELRCFSEGAGIPDSVPIHVAENGYPTGSGRSYETQKAALETMVGTVAEYRATYNVTDYRWFDLRDADTSSPNFQQQYGLMRDDYTPKPAYASWKRLIGELSVKAEGPLDLPGEQELARVRLRLRCYSRGVRARVVGRDAGRVTRVVFRARGTRLVDRRRPFRRSVRLRGARRVRVRAAVMVRDLGTIRLKRTSPRCAG
jgi:hypothetical protein